MTDVRPLVRGDLREAAALFELVMGSGERRPNPAMVGLLERTLFDQPWADRELPSLVATDERDRVVGLMGADVRRMRLGERRLRVVWSNHLVVEPAARVTGIGAILLSRLLRGAQDATVTDTASGLAPQMWGFTGGETLHLRGIHWVRVFRPWQVAAHLGAAKLTRPRARAALHPLAGMLDGVTSAAARRILPPTPVDVPAEPLTPRALVEALPIVGERLTLRPDYDEAFLEWLYVEMRRVKRRGRLIAQLLRGDDGQPFGWYMYYLRPGWRSEVLQVAARGRHVGRVLDHLLHHAYANGSAAVRGRLEPYLVDAVVRRRCVLWHRGGVLIHSRDPEFLRAVHSERALMTRLEGEWWSDALV